jgi:predicted small secreted protein
MVRYLITAAIVGGSLAVAACNTVRGAGADLQSAANCTENAIKSGYC